MKNNAGQAIYALFWTIAKTLRNNLVRPVDEFLYEDGFLYEYETSVGSQMKPGIWPEIEVLKNLLTFQAFPAQ
jgi:hypothetical protein